MPPPLEILFPAAGVVRRLVFSAQGRREPFPTPWAYNTRTEDILTKRLRGGSFVGISAAARVSPVYRDRAITFATNVITAARQGDSTDTSLSVDVSDTARPIIFQLALADTTGGTVVAVIPHKDAYLLCFTATETWVLQGDPATGAMRRVSDEVGIVGADAWCVAHDTVYFLSSHGLYQLGADGSGLQAVSEDRVPEELTGVADATCTLTYQHSDRGVYIHTTGQDWLYDIAREGFWPFDTSTTDSHLLIGPLKLGNTDWQGLIQTLHGIVAEGSATVNWRIVPGTTAEEAAANGKLAITADLASNDYSSYVRGSGSWTAGRSSTERPRTSAMWAVIWLSSAGTWAYERITMQIQRAGKWRA